MASGKCGEGLGGADVAQVEPEAESPGVTQRRGVVRDVVGNSGHSRPTLPATKYCGGVAWWW